MTRKRTNANKNKRHSNVRSASADAMFAATDRANSLDRSKGYFYGNMGDSIERRAPHGSLLGGGYDGYQGVDGPGHTWQAQGYGNYLGTGFLNGVGRMHSGVHNGYNNGGFTYLRRFSSNAAFNHSILAQCQLAYVGYGVVRNIVDLYADFASEGVEITHVNESTQNFYRTWATKVNLRERIYSLFLNLFIFGNVFCHRRWATLDANEKRAMKRAKSSENINNTLLIRGRTKDTTIEARESGFIDYYLNNKGAVNLSQQGQQKAVAEAPPTPQEEELPENPEKRIPWGYTFLNPLQMEVRGRRLRGDHYWVMAIDKRDTLDIARGMGLRSTFNQDLGTTEINLPKEFLSRIKAYNGPGAGYAAEVKLNKEELSVVQAPCKWDWFDWAIPFVFPALRALSFKDCLRNMEVRACESVINSVFLFKLGDIEKGFVPDDEQFERLADMLQMPGQAINILWNEAIEAEVIQADVSDIFDAKKHDSADKDILTALGVPEVLLGGKGGNFSNSFIGVSTVLERLESYRKIVHQWLMGELKVISDAMGFQKMPNVKFGRTSLKDEKAYQAFLTGLYDRGILSGDTLLQEANTTAELEAVKMKHEKDSLREKDIFEPKGPYVKEPKVPPGGAKPGGAAPKPKTPNGRPTNTGTGPTGKQSNPRGPKGQNVAEILELQDQLLHRGRAMLNQVEEFIGTRLLRAKAKDNPNLKNLKQLRLEERERLEQLIYNVFSHMPPPSDGNPLHDDFIINMLKSDAAESVKADVLSIYTQKVAEYSQSYGKVPTRETRRQFMVSAWTQMAIMEHVRGKPELIS